MPDNSEKIIERRKHRRYQVQDGAFAALTSPSEAKLGLICDISKAGLAFRYVADKNDQKEYTTTSCSVNILYDAEGFYLENLPCSIVWDQHLHGETSFSHLTVRKCSVCFDGLSTVQHADLAYFLDNHAKPSLPAG
jgi:hypothetical protein